MVSKAVVTKLSHSRNCPALPYSKKILNLEFKSLTSLLPPELNTLGVIVSAMREVHCHLVLPGKLRGDKLTKWLYRGDKLTNWL